MLTLTLTLTLALALTLTFALSQRIVANRRQGKLTGVQTVSLCAVCDRRAKSKCSKCLGVS